MSASLTVASPQVRSAVQRAIRRRVARLELVAAIRRSADGLFRFTHRARNAKALWSETACVWLGRTTFLHWALEDANIDIPWVISGVAEAPRSSEQLREAVKLELTQYWKDQLAALPRKSTGSWLPLP